MDVPERPVVEADAPQVVESAGAVVAVAGGGAADVAVQNAYLDAGTRPGGEAQRQVLRLAAFREAHALDGRKGDATDLDRHSLGGSGAEDRDTLGPGVAEGRPACLDRVVIAVNDEAGDARVRQALKAVTEAQLCP